jgi:hypothetical protein
MNIWRRSARSRTNKSPAAKARPRRFETLEDRRMMAHTAMADVFGGTEGVYAPEGSTPSGYISVVQELNLNSRPGAPATLFLDFNGHYQTERVGMAEWQDFFVPGTHGWDHILTPAFDQDNDPLTFSPEEQQRIRFIWASVAEDYAPFNINVTTVDPDPGLYHTGGNYLRVVVSGEKNFTGNSEFDGGLGEYDAYADDDGANVAYVFGRKADGGLSSIRFMAEAASHEAAHTFGLEHRDKSTGNALRAPIMRKNSASDAERGVWWDGDMGVIASSANGFGYRADDHANSFAGASQLTATNAGLFGRGVIEQTSDVDVFQFTTGGGNVSINVTLPIEADGIAHPNFPRAKDRNIGNLDATLRLYNSSGALIAQDSDPSLLASLSANLTVGTYYVQVGSYGLAGDVGQYSLLVNETTGPQIVGASYQSLSPTLMGLWVTFNEPINPLSFTAADVAISGGSVASVTASATNPAQFLVTINASTSAALPAVTIGPNISDRFGNLMDQNKDGIKGTTADVYKWNMASGGASTTVKDPLTLSPTKTSRTLATKAVDAYFARY